MIHLSLRAIELLQAGVPKTAGKMFSYQQPKGLTACGEPPDEWCRTEDVRAIVRGHKTRYLYGSSVAEPVQTPTCPKCSVLLDAAFEGKLTAELLDQVRGGFSVKDQEQFVEAERRRVRVFERWNDPDWMYPT